MSNRISLLPKILLSEREIAAPILVGYRAEARTSCVEVFDGCILRTEGWWMSGSELARDDPAGDSTRNWIDTA